MWLVILMKELHNTFSHSLMFDVKSTIDMSSVNKPPYRIREIHHVNLYNIIENEDIAYL